MIKIIMLGLVLPKRTQDKPMLHPTTPCQPLHARVGGVPISESTRTEGLYAKGIFHNVVGGLRRLVTETALSFAYNGIIKIHVQPPAKFIVPSIGYLLSY